MYDVEKMLKLQKINNNGSIDIDRWRSRSSFRTLYHIDYSSLTFAHMTKLFFEIQTIYRIYKIDLHSLFELLLERFTRCNHTLKSIVTP